MGVESYMVYMQKHPQPFGWGCCFLAAVQEELLADGAQHLLENGHCHVRGDLLLDGVLLLDQLLKLVVLHCVHHGDESFHVVHSPFELGYIRMLIGISFIYAWKSGSTTDFPQVREHFVAPDLTGRTIHTPCSKVK